METFSLLKYWRGTGGDVFGHGGGGGCSRSQKRPTSSTTAIVAAVTNNVVESSTEDDEDNDGPFFDLEFAVPEEEVGDDKNEEEDEITDVVSDEDEDGMDDDREFKFTLSSGSSNERTDPNPELSPSDDIFFKGKLVPIEQSSLELDGSEPYSRPQFPVLLLKSATKFRVFMLGLKKSKATAKAEKTESSSDDGSATVPANAKQQQTSEREIVHEEKSINDKQRKPFTVKFKVEEVPFASLFTSSKNTDKSLKQNSNPEESESTTDERLFSKDVMQKYLKKVKPLYVRVSRRYGEKLRFSGQLSLGSGAKQAPPQSVTQNSPTGEKRQPGAESTEVPTTDGKSEIQKQGNLPAGLRVVRKHLWKSRSASSAVAAAPSPGVSNRRDDSLLQQQDGIQGAILHCKRSFNASRDSESSLLSRCVSDPSHKKSIELSDDYSEEGKNNPL
ncbi:membrane-associated kinase regulator 2 [Tripterygium wilfordii]|uniref:Membrane-associated kinase regulator 2 n=1 Tax=Tripterygium wilfordii TaxID=458696 RepID=A0A7J7C7D4_TRIWF|nr:probable membrane-associated kinase regulator 2 [Tripterygium wilfordii]KAF5730039.1 membrane-associated kinase regulator 2 [Tripterygium wilfordii]